MLSQWFLPTENVTENDIMHCLDDIAETVKQHLPEDLASKYNQGKCLDDNNIGSWFSDLLFCLWTFLGIFVGDVECYLIIALPTHFIIMHSKKSSALTLPPTQKKNIKLEFHSSYVYFTGNVHMWIDANIKLSCICNT